MFLQVLKFTLRKSFDTLLGVNKEKQQQYDRLFETKETQ